MPKFLMGSILFALATLSGSTFAATETLTGQLIDMACYAQDKANTGIAHKGKGMYCAQACAREGFPVGLLTSDGKVYRIAGALAANSNAKLVPHMAQMVTISGEISQQDKQLMITASDLESLGK